jgi:sugar-specific transcriptional regulator TrmB
MDALKTIGLNLYERKLWIALLAKGTATAGELSQMSNVPRSRTYDTLESLAEKGFVMAQVGKPARFVAINPEEALERVKRKIELDAEETKKRIDEFRKSNIVKELGDLFGKGIETITPEEIAITVKGRSQLNQQMSSMFRNAKKSVQIVTNIDGLKDLYHHHFNSLKKANASGVDISIASTIDESGAEAAKHLSNISNVRSFDKSMPVKGNFVVVDGNEMLFSLTEHGKVHETKHVAVWSKSEHIASDVLEPLFKIIWGSAKPVE